LALIIGIRDAESVADSDSAVGWAIARLNLETAVGRARWCVGSGGCREATTLRAGARKEARQRQAREPACQRVRSGLTWLVNIVEGRKVRIHAQFGKAKSGQLRFPG
jgi:hypothetical protein